MITKSVDEFIDEMIAKLQSECNQNELAEIANAVVAVQTHAAVLFHLTAHGPITITPGARTPLETWQTIDDAFKREHPEFRRKKRLTRK